MSTFRNPTSKRSALIAAALLAATAAPGSAAAATYQSETYGRASGDTPLPSLGLVLELVDGDTTAPKLRLFGGVPGNAATILVSGAADAVAGPHGSTVLLAGQPIPISGTFDWMGYFEVSIDELPDRAAGVERVYAQGMQTGAAGIDATLGTMLELSNGLEFFPAPDPVQSPFSLADLKPNLPEHRLIEMQDAEGLEAKLRTALNSPGDEVVVTLEVSASVAIVAAVNVGGEIGLGAKVTRRDDGRYDVEIGGDAAAKAGVEACEGVEANAKQGVGGTRIFRFHSVAGVARGLQGLTFALRFPNLQLGRTLAESGAFDAIAAGIEELRQRHEAARALFNQAENALWTIAGQRLEVAKDRCQTANAAYRRAKSDLDGARFPTIGMYANVAVRYAIYRAALANYDVARAAYDVAKTAVETAKQGMEEARLRLVTALDAIARVGRIGLVIAQTGTFAKDHYAGFEVRLTAAAEAEAMLGIPGVKLAGVGAGVEGELSQQIALRWEEKTEHAPRRVTITRTFEQKTKLVAADGIGAEVENQRTFSLVDAFEIAKDESKWVEHSAKLTTDNRLSGMIGALVVQKTGIGRTRELWINQEELLGKIGNVLALFADDGLVAAADGMGFTEVGFSLQDRFVDSIDFGLGISYAGYGGGIEGSIAWSDRGGKLEKSTTIHDAVEGLIATID